MKRIINYITLLAIILFVGCKPNEPELFKAEDASIMFDGKAAVAVGEAAGVYKIPVILAGVPSSNAVSVKVSIDAEQSTAVEGTDFTVLTETLSFPEGYGIDTVEISINDNSEFTGDKKFTISLGKPENAKLGVYNTATISIVDDEHPLAVVLGSYVEQDFLLDGALEGTYAVSIAAIPNNLTQVTINNFWGAEMDIIATVDLENGTISILPGQTIYVDADYGECKAVAIDLAEGIYIPEEAIVGTITADGITFGAWAALVDAGAFGNYSATTFTRP